MSDAQKNLILVVCTANICRSPMGEALLRHALAGESEQLTELTVASAGVAAYRGEKASANSVKALKNVGIELSSHSSQPVTQELLDQSLMVLCMTESHRAMIALNFEQLPPHIYLFRELMPPGSEIEIPDPYGQAIPAYESSRDSMVEAVPHILRFLKEQALAGK